MRRLNQPVIVEFSFLCLAFGASYFAC